MKVEMGPGGPGSQLCGRREGPAPGSHVPQGPAAGSGARRSSLFPESSTSTPHAMKNRPSTACSHASVSLKKKKKSVVRVPFPLKFSRKRNERSLFPLPAPTSSGRPPGKHAPPSGRLTPTRLAGRTRHSGNGSHSVGVTGSGPGVGGLKRGEASVRGRRPSSTCPRRDPVGRMRPGHIQASIPPHVASSS